MEHIANITIISIALMVGFMAFVVYLLNAKRPADTVPPGNVQVPGEEKAPAQAEGQENAEA